jgi:hypothetical protein
MGITCTTNLEDQLLPSLEIWKAGLRSSLRAVSCKIFFTCLQTTLGSFFNCLHGSIEVLAFTKPQELSPLTTPRAVQPRHQPRQSLIQVKNWIELCSENHQLCREESRPSFLPTRLIRIEKDPVPDLFHASLCEDKALSHDTSNPTFSHRWAQQDLIKLTSGNID